MMTPALFGENLLDDFFGFPFRRNYVPSFFGEGEKHTGNFMRTDVKEHDGGYTVSMDLPGFKKEDVKGELKDGYLTITASTNKENDEKDEKGRFIRRERYSGTCSRSFYVGENVTQEEIRAKFEDGVLHLEIPKKEAKPVEEKSRFISIEG
ncbi:MAG: Hsp20/alpha crystallin family protein [Lachnospiraceae bacterium]|nr:Hsp20/alpha crystallin family protein [Lachnospiraceae bacterium]